jgi:hypothetical protein
MKTFQTVCAQGELEFVRIGDTKSSQSLIDMLNAKTIKPENGFVIVGHSETGHHHVMEADKVDFYQLPDDITKCLLVVNSPTTIKHLRDYDTHEEILFEEGVYIRTILREHDIFGEEDAWRLAAD